MSRDTCIDRPEGRAISSSPEDFYRTLVRAMLMTEGWDPGLWYDDPAIEGPLREGQRLGLVTRRSVTQVHFSAKGSAEIPTEIFCEVGAAVRAERQREQDKRNAQAEGHRRQLRAEAERFYRECYAADVEARKASEAQLARAVATIEARGPEAYVEKMCGEWWVDVEGAENPSPFKRKMDAVEAVRKQVACWEMVLAEPLRPYRPKWNLDGTEIEEDA